MFYSRKKGVDRLKAKRRNATVYRFFEKSTIKHLIIGFCLIIICVILLNTAFKTPALSELEQRNVYIENITEYTDGRYANFILLQTDKGQYYCRYGEDNDFSDSADSLTNAQENKIPIIVYLYSYPEVAEALAVNGYDRIIEIRCGDEIIASVDDFDSFLSARRAVIYLIMTITVIWLGLYIYAAYSDIKNHKKP